MKRSETAVRIGAELIPVLLVLGCLGGSLALIIAAHQRQTDAVRERASAVVLTPPKRQPPKPLPTPAPPPPPEPEPPEDPTKPIVAAYAAQADEQRLEAARSDAKVVVLEAARLRAEAEIRRWRQRERLVRDQADRLEAEASRLETEADSLARLRDVLAHRRDQEKADLVQARSRARDAFAVLPYRGEHGTWRRPIALECRNGLVKIQPNGPTFSILEIAGDGFSPRSNSLVAAVSREFGKAKRDVSPDGGTVVPYILFIIRPDGIRPYYEARSRLERLGIAFGYELVGQDVTLDFPDLDDPTEWPGAPPRPTVPLWPDHQPALADSQPGTTGRPGTAGQPGVGGGDGPYVWHASEPPPPPPSRAPGRGLSFSDLEGDEPGRLLADEGQGRGVNIDGIDLSGPPIPYEPDPRRPGAGTGSGSGSLPGRIGAGSPSIAGLGRTGGPSRLPQRSGQGGLGWPGAGRGLGRPGQERGLGLPGDGQGLSSPGYGRSGDLAGASGKPGELVGMPPARVVGEEAEGDRSRPGDSEGHDSPFDASSSPGNPDRPGSLSETGTGRVSDGEQAGRLTQGGPGADRSRSTAGAGESPGLPELPLPADQPAGNRAGQEGTGSLAAHGRASGGSPTPEVSRTPGRPGGGPGAPSLGGSGSNPAAGLGFGLGLPSSTMSGVSPPESGMLGLGSLPHTVGQGGQPEAKRLSLVIDCRPEGVTIQPGGYRLSRQALESSDLLVRRLQAIVRADPDASRPDAPRPWLNFLVQPGGQQTFWVARRQTTFAGLDWPATLRVAESGGLESFTGSLR